MSLSILSRVAPTRPLMSRIVIVRFASVSGAGPISAKQVPPPSNEAGFYKYERNISRNPKYSNPQQLGDTPMRFLFRRLGHAYEVYPLFFLTGVWFIMFCYVCYISFEKVEIWLDRSQEKAPWDWERIRNNYWKQPTLIFDVDGRSHKRLEIMEKLQDEMVEAAKKRGTR
uniref:Uncharacterized protein n=1 Tax=Panagrolaimus sp. JU765 TaxID=591449 RepID=A0AC34QU39_9BILA